MAQKLNPLIVIVAILGVIYLLNSGLLSDLFTIQLSRDTVFIEDADLDDVVLELRQEKDPLVDSVIVINDINPSSVTSSGPSPYSYYYADPVDGWVGKGACAGLISKFDTCCQRLGYERFLSDTGWNVCVGTSKISPDYVTISIEGVQVYEWDGVDSFPQYSEDISSIVNDACGLYTPLAEREYVSLSCNNAPGTTYSEMWTKCVQEVSIDSSCPSGTSLIAKLEATDLCGVGPEYDSDTPSDCFLPLTIDTGNGYGQLSLSVSTNQLSATDYVAVSREDCPSGFTEIDGICYFESDLSSYLDQLPGYKTQLLEVQEELSSLTEMLTELLTSVSETNSVTDEQLTTVEDALSDLKETKASLEDSLNDLAVLESFIDSSRDATAENKADVEQTIVDFADTLEDVGLLITDLEEVIVELESYQQSSEETTGEETISEENVTEETVSETTTEQVSSESTSRVTRSISEAKEKVSEVVDSLEEKTGIQELIEDETEIFGYSFPSYYIVLFLVGIVVAFIVYRRSKNG